MFAPQLAKGRISGNLSQPGAQSLRLAQFGEFSPRRQKGLLPGILAGREISQNSQRDPAHHGLVPRDNLHEGPRVPAPGRLDQLRISQGCAAVALSRGVLVASHTVPSLFASK